MPTDSVPSSWNHLIASRFREAADLLAQQDDNPFRVRAYRRAADEIDSGAQDISKLALSEGIEGLMRLPGIGRGMAAAILEMVRFGRWTQLDRLRGSLDAEKVFRTIPGIGPELAKTIHDRLQIDSLEALETAAHDGRLEALPRIGRRRADAVRHSLAQMLGRNRPDSFRASKAPSIEALLDVDREYREKVQTGQLRTIAPRRFNPKRESWLPILHTSRDEWAFTALFSNTARAHELGRTRDWVILYFHTDHDPEGQCTVVTETQGSLTGKRVVRGHETECATYYGIPAATKPGARAGQGKPDTHSDRIPSDPPHPS